MKNGKVVVGLLAGVAAGAALGVLFAPHSGKRTRRQISQSSEDFTDEVKDKFSDLLSSINHKYEKIMKEAGVKISNGKSNYEGAKKEIKHFTT